MKTASEKMKVAVITLTEDEVSELFKFCKRASNVEVDSKLMIALVDALIKEGF